MNLFEKSEKIGRAKFHTLMKGTGVDNYVFSKDHYAVWDAKFQTDTGNYLVEIKARNCSHTAYPTFILEEKKYNALCKLLEQKEPEEGKRVDGYYINFFSDGYFAAWSIKDVDVSDVTVMKCKRFTARYDGYIDKRIIPLDISDAKMFGRIDESGQVFKMNYNIKINSKPL